MSIDPPETMYVETPTVCCDGDAGDEGSALGHPAVYLNLGASGRVECPYCDREFVLKGSDEGVKSA